MTRTKKVNKEEKITEWGITLQEMILDVERHYEKQSSKEVYDFLISLQMAQRTI